MPDFELIPVPDLPDDLTQEAARAVRLHSVSIVVAGDNEREGLTCGGVFVLLDSLPGILTAAHVWDRVRKAKVLVLMIGSKQVYRIRADLLHAYSPAGMLTDEVFGTTAPDLAFIPLSVVDKGAIEVRGKVFYSVDRRHGNPAIDLHGDDGLYMVIGSPRALMRPEERAVSSLTYITGIDRHWVHEDWDYLLVNLDVEKNPALPLRDFVGMSGGGVWRIKFQKNAKGEYSIKDIGSDVGDVPSIVEG